VTEHNVTGISLTGLALVGGEDVTGLSVAGLALVADRRVAGLGATIGRMYADEVRGVTVAGWLKTWDQRGLSISPYTQIKGAQRGLAIGIFNTGGRAALDCRSACSTGQKTTRGSRSGSPC
jgi:hypothetical protein